MPPEPPAQFVARKDAGEEEADGGDDERAQHPALHALDLPDDQLRGAAQKIAERHEYRGPEREGERFDEQKGGKGQPLDAPEDEAGSAGAVNKTANEQLPRAETRSETFHRRADPAVDAVAPDGVGPPLAEAKPNGI